MLKKSFMIPLLVFAAVNVSAVLEAQNTPQNKQHKDLTELAVEDLMRLEVTTASKRAQPLSAVPAAIFVLTNDDIRRAGAATLPDALRMVPGVQVAQIDGNKWAITVRGFNGQYADKLLVLLDGRSVYSPTTGGVYWDALDVVMEDIERIEVIRGPGGALWGANAMNGVINIITKNAADTQGELVAVGAATEDTSYTSLRYGGKAGKSGYYRFYGKYAGHDSTVTRTGDPAGDGWETFRSGFRFDSSDTSGGKLMFQGEIYGLHPLDTVAPAVSHSFNGNSVGSGWHLLGRWERAAEDHSSSSLQVYIDRTDREDFGRRGTVDNADLEWQHNFSTVGSHTLAMGAGYRRTSDNFSPSATTAIVPSHQVNSLFQAFIQDEIRLKTNLNLTIGAKLEHNDYTGFEIQPNVRLAFTPTPSRTFWAAVSRAVRTPSREDTGLLVHGPLAPGPGGIPIGVVAQGNPYLASAKLLAYEAGYRATLSDRLLLDITAFYNSYDHLRTLIMGTPFLDNSPPTPHLVIPLSLTSDLSGETHGIELAAWWKLSDRSRVTLTYSHMDGRLHGPVAGDGILRSPRNQASIAWRGDLPGHVELDSMLYMTDRLTELNVAPTARLDLRLGWRPNANLELSIGAQNLLDTRHFEFGDHDGQIANMIERSIFGKVTWRR
jgi:iron complex outermembrane receptor protein